MNTMLLLAQDGREANEAMQQKVVQFFNAKQIDSLYGLAGEAFKKQLTADKFKTICENNLFPLGEIKAVELEKYENSLGKYKATLTKVILSMYISVDAEGKLETFLFQPYKKEVTGTFTRTVTDNKLVSEMDKKIDDIVQQFMFESKTRGLSMGVLKGGKISFYNYGETRKGNTLLPSSKNLYEIGSITKTFTALLLAKAVGENKMKLNDPVNKYLPKDIPTLKFGDDTLKIVHLSNHTSALPSLPDNFGATDLINPYKDYDETLLYAYLKNAKLQRKPGERFEYSNLAVGLLGNILEHVNKMPYEKMVKEFVCAKAGMMDTKQFLLKNDSALFVQGYDTELAEQGQWDFKALAAAGCIRSSAADMMKYATMLLSADTRNDYLKKAVALTHESTFVAGQQQIGLNWFLQNWGSGTVFFHGGQTGGYKSFFVINERTKNALVILANTAVSNDEIGVSIMQYLDK
ncbi:serine hydrolase [Ferruginibacter sp.]